ncbi:MAG: FAD-dependent oxidoreductase [Rhodobacteraceae bacterium]|nr:FAD-dependent oxidoreductase [Paracoccaceae bacterium]
MTEPVHHVIIGSGSAGFGAARTLRENDADCRITMFTMDAIPFYQRYELPQIFRGRSDWRDLLAVPPSFYEDHRIDLRRRCRVADVDGANRKISLSHQETVAYDRLLVCAGGRGYLPENLTGYGELIHGFGSFEAAMQTYRDLPEGGRVVMIGGDMVGIDLALTLLDTGYGVTLITNSQTFWPHELGAEERAPLLDVLRARGVTVLEDARAVRVEARNGGAPARCVTLDDGAQVQGDVVMAFCGLASSVEFMLRAAVDIERGLLVNPQLRTTNETIWAAGDVCQIWHDSEKAYKFYHGWKNVRVMGELAARNMQGANEVFDVDVEESIGIGEDGEIVSTFWTRGN